MPGAPNPEAALTAALAAAQAAFPAIHKGNTATVRPRDKPSYSYTYADLSDVLAAVRPVLAEHGLAVTQPTVYRDGKLLLRTELRHTGGGSIASEVELAQSPSAPQQFGGALTYLRRYELTTLLGIAAEEDRDAQDVEPDRGRRSDAPPEPPAWAKPAVADAAQQGADALARIIGSPDLATELLEAIRETTGGGIPVIANRTILGIAARLEEAAEVGAQDNAAEDPDVAADAARAAAEDPDPQPDDPDLEASEEAPDGPAPASIGVGELPQDPAVATGVLKAAGCTCPYPLGDPLGDPPKLDDQCPIIGHGIPF